MKKISIIIPTYKRAEFLDRAIESCLNQTYKNIEIIVVDDNEMNSEYSINTKKIVDKYPSVKYLKNPGNIGAPRSRNNGIKNATGEFIAFLDDDDEYYPTKIQKQLECYKNANDNKCCMVYCYGEIVNDNGNIIPEIRDVEGNALYEHMVKHIAVTSYWFCPKDILLKENGFIDEQGCEEGLLLLTLLEKGYTVYRVPEVLAKRYEHSVVNNSGITNISPKYIEICKLYMNRCLKIADNYEKKRRNKVYQIKYYWIFNMYYVSKNKTGKKEYLKKILQLKMFNLTTFKAIFKYFINN